MRPGSTYEDLGLTQRFMNLEWRLENVAPGIDVSSESVAMRELMTTLDGLASTDVPLVLRGELGTGKTTLAWLVHERSHRREGPFVAVNCTALREWRWVRNTTERKRMVSVRRLVSARVASLRLLAQVDDARHGTLFLDEVDDLPADLARRLVARLRSETSSAADDQEREVNIRVVVASSRERDQLRLDESPSEILALALGARVLRVPTLRERREDIAVLAEHFLRSLAGSMQRRAPRLTEAAKRRLVAYSWPGNIRELRNVVEHALLVSRSDVVDVAAFRGRLNIPERTAGAESCEGATHGHG